MAELGGVAIDIFGRLNMASFAKVFSQVNKMSKEEGAKASESFAAGFDAMEVQFKSLARVADNAYRDMELSLSNLQVAEARINALRSQNFGRHAKEMIDAQRALNDAIAEGAAAQSRAAEARTRSALATPIVARGGGESGGGRGGEEPRGRGGVIPMGRGANILGGGAAVLGGVLGAEGLKIDAKAEGTLNDILTRFQDNAGNVALIKQNVYRIAGETGVHTKDLAEAAEAAEQAGYKGQRAVDVLQTSAKAAQIAHTTVKEAMSGLTTTMHDFHINDLQGADFINKMNDAAGKFVVTIANLKDVNPAELFKSYANVEPIAGSYMPNVDSIQATTQIDAIMAVLSQTGMPPERGALNLAQTISKFGTSKGTAAKALMQLGLKPEDIATETRDKGFLPVLSTINDAIEARKGPDGMYNMGWKFNDAGQLKELQQMDVEQLQGMGDQGQAALALMKQGPFQAGTATNKDIKKAFEDAGITDPSVTGALKNWLKFQKLANGPSAGVQGGMMPELTKAQVVSQLAGTGDVQRNMLAVMENLPEVGSLQQQYGAYGNSQGFDKAFDQWKQSLPAKLQIFEGQMEELAGSVGQKMLPAMTHFVEKLNGVADWLDKHKVAEQALVDTLFAIGGLWAGAKLINLGTEVAKAFGPLKTGADALGTFLSNRLPTQFGADATDAGATLKTGAAAAGTGMQTAGETMKTSAVVAGEELKTEVAGSGIGGALRGAAASISQVFSAGALALLMGQQMQQYLQQHPVGDPKTDPKATGKFDINNVPPSLQNLARQPWQGNSRGGIVGYAGGTDKVVDPYSQPLMGQPDMGGDSLLGMLPGGKPVGLRGGEGILTPEAVQALGGKDALDELNNGKSKNPFDNPRKAGLTMYKSFAEGVQKYSPWGKYLAANATGLEAMESESERAEKEHEQGVRGLLDGEGLGGGRRSHGIPLEIQQMLASGMSPQQIMQQLGAHPGKRGGMELGNGQYMSAKERQLLGVPSAYKGNKGNGWRDLQGDTGPLPYSDGRGDDPRAKSAVHGAFKAAGYSDQDLAKLDYIIDHESHYRLDATNPSTGDFGVFQFNPAAGNVARYLPDKSLDPNVQAQAGLRYIKEHYGGDMNAAYQAKIAQGWYSRGGIVGYADGGTVDPNGPLGPSGPTPNDSGAGAPGFDNPNFPDWWKQRLKADLPIDNAWMPNNPHDWGPGMPKLPWMAPSGGHGPMMGYAGGGIAGLGFLPLDGPNNPPAPPGPSNPLNPQSPDNPLAPKDEKDNGPKIYTAPGAKQHYHTANTPSPQGHPAPHQPKGQGSHPDAAPGPKGTVPNRSLIPGGTQPKDDRKILGSPSRQLEAEGKGFGVGGGILGAAESAASSMGGPFGAAAQPAFQLMNRAIGYGGQLVGIGMKGLMETFLPNDSPMADPSKNLFGKIALGIAGAHPGGENVAGKHSMQLKPKQDLDEGEMAAKQQPVGGGGIHIHGDVHNHGQQEHEGMAKAVNKALFGGGYLAQH